MRCVLDTNVLASALINPRGKPAIILGMVKEGRIIAVFDPRMVQEYRDVLTKPRFKFPVEIVDLFIEILVNEGEPIIAISSDHYFEDISDKVFYDTAVFSHADYLITGNLLHFPDFPWIVSPSKFLELISE